MTGRGELDTARAALASLNEQTAQLQASVENQADALTQAQRAARDGQASLKQVSDAQGRHQAAQGVLSLHLSDVEQAGARVDDLTRAAQAADREQEARELARVLRETSLDFTATAAQAEADLKRALDDLKAVQTRRAAAAARLASLTRAAISDAHNGSSGTPYQMAEPLNAQQSPERLTGAAFLASIDPALTEHDVFGVSGLGLSDMVYPLLSRVEPR
jgi:hypothetical protein